MSETELSQMGEDTDGLVTSTSKLQAKVKALTGGFDIMKDKNNYKDIYDIVVGIGEAFPKMSDVNRASLLELLAGKHQSNALAAELQNVEVIKQAYNTAANESEGSAQRELENYQKGIEYSLDKFKATFQELSTNTLDSDVFKFVIDSGTALVAVLNEIVKVGGGIPDIFATIGSIKLFQNLDLFYY